MFVSRSACVFSSLLRLLFWSGLFYVTSSDAHIPLSNSEQAQPFSYRLASIDENAQLRVDRAEQSLQKAQKEYDRALLESRKYNHSETYPSADPYSDRTRAEINLLQKERELQSADSDLYMERRRQESEQRALRIQRQRDKGPRF